MKNLKNYISYFALLCATLGYSQILFTESSISQGINVSHGSTNFMGGLAFFDFDGDGWDDLTYASEDGEPVYFFKNNNGTFNPIAINFTDYQTDTRQINWVDIDNDGDNDLFIVSNNASNRLYENDGSMNFSDITASSGISMNVMSSWGAAWGDYNNDGYLDLFLSNRDFPDALSANLLYKNNGNNTFTDVSVSAGIDTNNHYSFCASFFDFNNDGWQDIYMANDRITTENILYKNNGNGTFSDVSVTSGTNIAMDAMSTTIDDYDYDGDLDIYVTNTSAGNYFLRNNGDETFTNIAPTNGTAFYSIGWGAVFLDADNDGDQDLYVSGSQDGSLGDLPSAFYENNGLGIFNIPTNAGFANDVAVSYSNAIGDINNDGYPDMTVINKEPIDNFLWTNSCNTSNNYNWLKITLEGTMSNKMGIGSWIEIQVAGNKQYRYTLLGEGYISQNSGAEFIGLKSNTIVDYVKVKWLSGIEDIIYNVNANQTVHFEEGSTLSANEFYRNEILVYPNPNNGIFQIKFSNEDNHDLEIYNIHGVKVFDQPNYRSSEIINISNLSKGVYFLKANNSDNQFIQKIILH